MVGSAPAAEDAGDPGDAAPDEEPGNSSADEHLLLVLGELLAPVRQLGDLALEALDREPELATVRLDGGADLLRRPGCGHQWRASSTVCLIRCASSIAICGLGASHS